MALGLAALYLMNQNLTEADKKSLVRLNNIPPENLEAKAKAQGLWHSKADGISPGDLAVFFIKDSCLPHVGLVTGVDSKGGTVKVRCESRTST